MAASEGFEGWYLVEQPRLANLLALAAPDLETARDVTAEAFARAYERWDRVALMERPSAGCERWRSTSCAAPSVAGASSARALPRSILAGSVAPGSRSTPLTRHCGPPCDRSRIASERWSPSAWCTTCRRTRWPGCWASVRERSRPRWSPPARAASGPARPCTSVCRTSPAGARGRGHQGSEAMTELDDRLRRLRDVPAAVRCGAPDRRGGRRCTVCPTPAGFARRRGCGGCPPRGGLARHVRRDTRHAAPQRRCRDVARPVGRGHRGRLCPLARG